MKVTSVNRSVLLRALCLTAFCFCLQVVAGEPTKPVQDQSTDQTPQANALPAGSAGKKGYVDPKTREIVNPTPAMQVAESVPVDHMLSTSSEGLKQVQNEARPGGYRMDLKGRFSSAMMVSVDAQGNQVVGCGADQHQHPEEK